MDPDAAEDETTQDPELAKAVRRLVEVTRPDVLHGLRLGWTLGPDAGTESVYSPSFEGTNFNASVQRVIERVRTSQARARRSGSRPA